MTVAALHDLILKGIELTNKRQKHPADGCSISRGNPPSWPVDPNPNPNDPGGRALLFEFYLLHYIEHWLDTVNPDYDYQKPKGDSEPVINPLYYYISPPN